ncbi:MAG: hypothetical protein AAB359_09780 [Elusimicrobiota bacterium]
MPETVRERRQAWTGRTRGGYAGNWIFIRILRFLGLHAAYLLLVPVAFYFILFAPGALKASTDYLRLRFKRSFPLRLIYSYRHFFCFGQVLLDRIALANNPGRFKVREEGLSYILDSIRESKGLVLLSAHAGGWEAAMSLLDKKQAPVNVVMFKGEAEKIRRLIGESAHTEKIRILGVSGSPEDSLAVIGALNRGEVVAMHGDRTVGGRTVKLPFLGVPADFPLWPYAVAAAANAPLIHTFAARTGTYGYRLKAWPAVKPWLERNAAEREPLRKYAIDFVSHLEEFLAEYPFQWFNFYPFWNPGLPEKPEIPLWTKNGYS